MSRANGSNGSDWAELFSVFHSHHRDKDGKKLTFTVVFNSHMEAFILESEVPLEWRVLAWILRHSWGNSSDFAVDKIGGDRIGQQECADRLGVDKRRISDAVVFLRGLNFLKPDTGHKLYPVDDPSEKSAPQEAKSPPQGGLFKVFLGVWKVRYAEDFQSLESARAEVNRLRKLQLAAYVKWQAERTNAISTPVKTTSPTVDGQKVESSSSVVVAVEEMLAKRKAEEEEPPPTFASLKALYPPQQFDEAKAGPLFEKLPLAEKRICIARLRLYLACDRWQDRQGKWIPFASNWLKSYHADPPAAFSPADTKTDGMQSKIEMTATLARYLRSNAVGGGK